VAAKGRDGAAVALALGPKALFLACDHAVLL